MEILDVGISCLEFQKGLFFFLIYSQNSVKGKKLFLNNGRKIPTVVENKLTLGVLNPSLGQAVCDIKSG